MSLCLPEDRLLKNVTSRILILWQSGIFVHVFLYHQNLTPFHNPNFMGVSIYLDTGALCSDGHLHWKIFTSRTASFNFPYATSRSSLVITTSNKPGSLPEKYGYMKVSMLFQIWIKYLIKINQHGNGHLLISMSTLAACKRFCKLSSDSVFLSLNRFSWRHNVLD